MNRRRYLAITGLASISTVTGCIGDSDDEVTDDEDSDTETEDDPDSSGSGKTLATPSPTSPWMMAKNCSTVKSRTPVQSSSTSSMNRAATPMTASLTVHRAS